MNINIVLSQGSGKTLAFGIPIAQYIASLKNDVDKHKLAALILTPTRELAIQVKNHIQNITCFMDIRVCNWEFKLYFDLCKLT